MSKIRIKQEANNKKEACKLITSKIILLSRLGIPRFYINNKLICLSHSNNDQMSEYEYVDVDGRLYQYLTVTNPELIIPQFIKQQGLNYNAPAFIPELVNFI